MIIDILEEEGEREGEREGGVATVTMQSKGTGRGWLCSEVVDKHLSMKSKLIFME